MTDERDLKNGKCEADRPDDNGVGRRSFIVRSGAAVAGAAVGSSILVPASGKAAYIHGSSTFRHPFTLGVASGDPLSNAVVIWTRLAPTPDEPGGGMPNRPFFVYWEISRRKDFRSLARRGWAAARPNNAHALHVDVRGLEPNREYYYRFYAGGEWSPTGRTRTAPRRGAHVESLRFAFTSCQDYEDGFYDSWANFTQEDIAINFFLGDYIYEGGPGGSNKVRFHTSPEVMDLEAYRIRYALYRSDENLQKAHAHCAWAVTPDDHEVDNDWSGDFATDPEREPPEQFRIRRAAAWKAYYEHMPFRRAQKPDGPDMLLYRALRYGDLAEFNILDTRQYRSKSEPCGFGTGPLDVPVDGTTCREIVEDPERTILGDEQEKWLFRQLRRSRSRWNVLAQQVPITKLDVGEIGGESEFKLDKWDAYPVARQRLLNFLHRVGPSNPVAITGDLHDNWVAELKKNHDRPSSPTVGTEFIGTSISSDGDGAEFTDEGDRVLNNGNNPHVHFHNWRRGYTVCELTHTEWTTKFRILPFVETPGAEAITRATWVVEDGNPIPHQTQGLPVFQDPFA